MLPTIFLGVAYYAYNVKSWAGARVGIPETFHNRFPSHCGRGRGRVHAMPAICLLSSATATGRAREVFKQCGVNVSSFTAWHTGTARSRGCRVRVSRALSVGFPADVSDKCQMLSEW